MFVIWGALHGTAIVIHRIWKDLGLRMWGWLGWLITFNFVNIAWVFFRAKDFEAVKKVLGGMVGMGGVVLPDRLAGKLAFLSGYGVEFAEQFMKNLDISERHLLLITGMVVFTMGMRNSMEWSKKIKPSLSYQFVTAMLLAIGILSLSKISQFLYFQF
jgi:hypothetical protein